MKIKDTGDEDTEKNNSPLNLNGLFSVSLCITLTVRFIRFTLNMMFV
jgi:hypothetical protein